MNLNKVYYLCFFLTDYSVMSSVYFPLHVLEFVSIARAFQGFAQAVLFTRGGFSTSVLFLFYVVMTLIRLVHGHNRE